ncbi:MAG: alanine racemase [Proteobacteria bacterium]|nr:MAG: alanine racemase [Pseudomonadota bacterium]
MAYISLDSSAYGHNLRYIGSKVGGISKIMAVLKDNAYGHGIEQMGRLASSFGIKRAVVKNTFEAKIIEPFFEKILILIEANPSKAIKNDKFIYTCDDICSIKDFPRNTNIHLKVDTGMRRNGVLPEQLDEVFSLLKKNNLDLEGVFTHFYGADIVGSEFYVQNECYKKVKLACKNLAKKYNFPPLHFHSCNSSASLRLQESLDDDFVRIGIASYGYTDLHESFGKFDLKPVLALWGEKICSRELKKDDTLGYGGAFLADRDMVVSSYDLGYGDGLFRQNGIQNPHVKNGKRFLGRMSMDCFSLEGIDEKVCVFDDVREFAKRFNTITYEILTQLSPFIPRVIK